MVTKQWGKSYRKCRDSGKFSQWAYEWARAGLETGVSGMRKQSEVSFGSQSTIPTLGGKCLIPSGRGDRASTGTTGKQNELVSTSRILYFYSHGSYSFFNLERDSSVDSAYPGIKPRISSTTGFHTVPADPFGELSKGSVLLCLLPHVLSPSKCAVLGVVSNWDNLKELGGNKNTNPTPHSEAEMLTGLQPCDRNTASKSG